MYKVVLVIYTYYYQIDKHIELDYDEFEKFKIQFLLNSKKLLEKSCTLTIQLNELTISNVIGFDYSYKKR
jgi:hypothetical protein